MKIIKMGERDKSDVIEMSREFYNSDAVSHTADDEKLNNVFDTAVSDFPTFEGFIFREENGEASGYSYISQYYESEIGGMCVMLIDIFVKSEYRGRGYASKFFEFVKKNYNDAKRFRLEVMPDNDRAINTYKKWGFTELIYKQMIIDK